MSPEGAEGVSWGQGCEGGGVWEAWGGALTDLVIYTSHLTMDC